MRTEAFEVRVAVMVCVFALGAAASFGLVLGSPARGAGPLQTTTTDPPADPDPLPTSASTTVPTPDPMPGAPAKPRAPWSKPRPAKPRPAQPAPPPPPPVAHAASSTRGNVEQSPLPAVESPPARETARSKVKIKPSAARTISKSKAKPRSASKPRPPVRTDSHAAAFKRVGVPVSAPVASEVDQSPRANRWFALGVIEVVGLAIIVLAAGALVRRGLEYSTFGAQFTERVPELAWLGVALVIAAGPFFVLWLLGP